MALCIGHGGLSLLAIAAYEQIPSVPVLLSSSTLKGFADIVSRSHLIIFFDYPIAILAQ
jgi:hypothetical protein